MAEVACWRKSRLLAQPLGFLWQKNVQPLHVAGAKQARHSELMVFHESWSWRLRVQGSRGLEIVPMAPGLQQAGLWPDGDRKSSELSDIVSYECLGRGSHPGSTGARHQLLGEKPSWCLCYTPLPHAHGTHGHTGACTFITHPTTPDLCTQVK